MPKFTQQELEEIRDNTERIEQERMARGAAKGKSKQELDGSDSDEDDADSATKSKGTKKTGSRSKKSSKTKKRKKGEYSVTERLVALILLGITIAISYAVMILNS